MENIFNSFFYGFTQSENRLLVLCQNGYVVEVHCPDLKAQKSTKTYKLSELPSRSFRFRSIKSQIKVCACFIFGVWYISSLYLLLVTESIATILVKNPLQFQTICLCEYFRETWKLQDVKL